MNAIRLFLLAALLAISLAPPVMVQAQTAQHTGRIEAQPKLAQAKQAKPNWVQRDPVALPQEHCLRALNGSCTNPVVVEAARLRAIILPTVRVSYLGTPMGTVGGKYIPFERLFQDNPMVFGLPTNVLVQACCITRSK
jgi:hypothetical protein